MKLSYEELQTVREYEKRRGIKYAVTGGKLYRSLLLFGGIAWIYSLVMVIFYILGNLVTSSGGVNIWNNTFITILTATVLTLCTPVLFGFKLKLTSFFINIATFLILAASFISLTRVSDSVSQPGSTITEYDAGFFGLKKIFFWRHGIPMLIVLVTFSWIAVIIIRDRIKVKKTHETVTNNRYTSQLTDNNE